MKDAIVAHGSYLKGGCTVENAIIGVRSRIEEGVRIKNAMIMGADFYESDLQRIDLRSAGKIPVGIGAKSGALPPPCFYCQLRRPCRPPRASSGLSWDWR